MGNEPANALTTDVAQRGKANEPHQNVVESVMQKYIAGLSTIHTMNINPIMGNECSS
jgi:hypothetical protein